MNMLCTISRNTGTMKSHKDSHGNLNVSWSTVASNVKCFIYRFEQSYGNMYAQDHGLQLVNKYVAVFKPGQDVKEGDKITCSKFTQNFTVVSANPIVHPTKNQTLFIECMMEIM